MAKKITQAEAKAFVQSLGMTFRKTEFGEFRVAYAPAPLFNNEASAYYTDDIEDAIDTAFAMSEYAEKRLASDIAAWNASLAGTIDYPDEAHD